MYRQSTRADAEGILFDITYKYTARTPLTTGQIAGSMGRAMLAAYGDEAASVADAIVNSFGGCQG